MNWRMVFGVIMLCACVAAAGEKGKRYPDGHGGTVTFPLGDISFADEVVAFKIGDPKPSEPKDRDPSNALGVPDYDAGRETGYVTLGCRGTLVLRFTDNALIDIEGPDLYVFEIGPAVEPTELAISEDGQTWVKVGRISGGKAEVDISSVAEPDQVFHYVRLTDLASDCSGRWPGADIDAVGAIGSAFQTTLSSAVLFDFDKATIKPDAAEVLKELVAELTQQDLRVLIIEGHTDAIGSEAYNQALSRRRAVAVRDFLYRAGLPGDIRVVIRAYGESRPVASNATEEGRARNRRVQIVAIPK